MLTFAYSQLSNKRAGWNKQAGGKFFEFWKTNVVEILTINKIILFQTNLLYPNIHSIDD
jgi:hypothetical protein